MKTQRNRLILNTPGNPTGVVFTRSEVEEIAAIVKETNITVISDEIYEKMAFDVLVKERGPEHQKTFTVEARVRTPGNDSEPEYTARGEGQTKKQAEQGAARKALEYLRNLDSPNPKSRTRSH